MAQPDGAVRVVTLLDNEGFNKGIERMVKAMDSLSAKMEKLGKTIETSFRAYVRTIQNAGDVTQNLGQNLSGAVDQTRELNEAARGAAGAWKEAQDAAAKFGNEKVNTDEYRALEKEISKAEAALFRLYGRRDRMEATEVHKNSRAYQALQYDIQLAEEELERLERAAENFKDNDDALSGESFNELTAAVNKAESALDKYQSKVDKMGALGASDSQWESIAYDIGISADEAEELLTQLDALRESGGIDTAQYDELSERIENLISEYAELEERATNIEDMEPPHIERWNNMVTLSGMVRDGFEGIKNATQIAGYAATHWGESFDRILGGIVQTAGRAGAALWRMVSGAVLSGLRRIGEGAAEAARNLTRMTARAITTGVKRLGGWLSNAAKSMTLFGRRSKSANSSLKRGFMTVLKYTLGIRSLYILFNRLRAAVKEGFQNLAQYSDETNKSLSAVMSSFTRLKNAIAGAFAPIVNVVAPALAQLMNGMSNATSSLGAFIAALSGQKTFIRSKEVQQDYAASLDKTSKAAEETKKQLAGFDELNILSDNKQDETGLNPEDMFETVPIEDTGKDFAEAVRDAWENADFTGIGEIVGAKIADALDSIPWANVKKTTSKIAKSLATLINGALGNKELFSGIGNTVAQAINNALESVNDFSWNLEWDSLGDAIMDAVEAACSGLNWTTINSALQGMARGFADALNTVFARRDVFEKVGNTIGKAINAAVSAGIAFLERFDFTQAARSMVAGLNEAVERIDWDSIGRLIGDAFGGVLQFIYTAITEFNWTNLADGMTAGLNEFVDTLRAKIQNLNPAEIGAAFGQFINACFTGVEWDDLGALVGELIGGAFTAAAAFIRTLDLGEIVQAIQDFFTNAIQRIDWNDVLTVFGSAALILALKNIILAHPVLSILVGAVLALGPELGNAIQKMIEDIHWDDVGKAISDSLIWALNRLSEAVESANWVEIGAAVGQALADMLTNIDWLTLIGSLGALLIDLFGGAVELLLGAIGGLFSGIGTALEESGHDVIGGFFKGIGDAISGVGAWIKEHIFDPFINGFKKAFGIASPSKVMEEQGGFIIDGFYQGILDRISNIKSWLKKNVLRPIQKAFDKAGVSINVAVQLIKDGWSNLVEFVGDRVQAFVSLVKLGWSELSEFVGNAVEIAVSLTKSGWSTLAAFVGDKVSAAVSLTKSGWSTLAAYVGDKVSAAVSLTKSGWSTLAAYVGTAVSVAVSLTSNFGATVYNWVMARLGTSSLVKFSVWLTNQFTGNNASFTWTTVYNWVMARLGTSSLVKFSVWLSNQFGEENKSYSWTTVFDWVMARLGAAPFIKFCVWLSNQFGEENKSYSWTTVFDWVMARLGTSRFIQFCVWLSNQFTGENKRFSWTTVYDWVVERLGGALKVGVQLVMGTKEFGGILSNGVWHDLPQFANGGILRAITQYAGGTLRAGSMFIAGEAGPEVVGHINGRTEVLNKSQIASAIYSAVLAGMEAAVNGLGRYIAAHMTTCTNAVISALTLTRTPSTISLSSVDSALSARLSALQSVPYQVPAYATGTVMPYEVVAEIRRQTVELKTAIHDEGEEIIQAVVSAISNHGLAVTQAIGNIQSRPSQGFDVMTVTDSVIDEINRRIQAYGYSPLLT